MDLVIDVRSHKIAGFASAPLEPALPSLHIGDIRTAARPCT
jgi:hypothetical protein